jgi:hypothetical protein
MPYVSTSRPEAHTEPELRERLLTCGRRIQRRNERRPMLLLGDARRDHVTSEAIYGCD